MKSAKTLEKKAVITEGSIADFYQSLIGSDEVYLVMKTKYTHAVSEKNKQFEIQGGVFLTDFVKYALQYAEMEKKRIGKRYLEEKNGKLVWIGHK
jgi:hypothetical protein